MNWKIKFFPFFILLLVASLTSGCLDSGRGGYPTVKSLTSTDGGDGDGTTDPEVPVTPTRPTDAITIENYCACQNGKAVVINNCEAQCADEDVSNSVILYVKTLLGAKIKEDSLLKNLYNWCNVAYGASTSPRCYLRVYNETTFSSKDLAVTSVNGQTNSFTVNLTGQMTFGKRYLAELVEASSGAKSARFNIKLEDTEDDDTTIRPLAIEHISMYNCVSRAAQIINNQANITAAVKLSYFFAPSDRPDPIPSSDKYTLCHDPYAAGQGTVDKSTYRRLFERPGSFALWGRKDGLFAADDTQTNVSTINVMIKEQAAKVGVTLSDSNYSIFGPFRWPIRPAISTSSTSGAESSSSVSSSSNMSSGESSSLPIIGYYMQPWVDTNDQPYCPTNYHFKTDKLMGVIGQYIGDTEAVFMARREDRTIVVNGKEQKAPADIILIREGILNKIWFYHDYDTNQDIPADYASAKSQTILFYWPPQYTSPLQKNANSSLYTVRFPTDIGESTSSTLGLPVKTPSDKRFGCIPKLEDEIY